MRVHRAIVLLLSFVTLASLVAQEPETSSTEARRKEAQQRELAKVSAVVKGRCVDGVTGEPLLGCKVEVHAWGGRRDGDLPADREPG